MTKEKYPLSLALVDYIPVVLTIVGQYILLTAFKNDFSAVYGYAIAGSVLMFTGGFLKSTWKTIIAANEKDIRWMENSLFPFLAPGACLFSWASFCAQRAAQNLESVSILIPIIISAVFLLWSISRINKPGKWFLPLVLLLTVSMGVVTWNAWTLASINNNPLAAWLFIISFLISLITAGVSRRAATIKMQWVMEISNSFSAAFFVLAALKLFS